MDQKKFDELLLTVRKPGRYVGGEWNAIRKEWTPERVKVCLAFPDVYEVGMSHLGIKILYGLLNEREDCLCERAFAPWPDFETVLRGNGIPLYGLESRRPLKDFDVLGFSVGHELCYTNILNMLDLGGIPLRSSDRTDGDPLVIAGGPAVFNPEPIAEFIDAFVIGDGEEVVGEIVDLYKGARGKGQGSRGRTLRLLAGIPGVYVPSLYRVSYNDDGTVKAVEPTEEGVPARVEKRIVRDLDRAYYPVKQIVPNIGTVHDRIAIEVMRGCKHACAFCQATATYRPCRERSSATVVELARQAYAATGYDEISLLSLSSVSYSPIRETIGALNAEFGSRAVSIAIPSLRVEPALLELPGLIGAVKKSGLTFAPEAGSERLRKSINKDIDMTSLLEACRESFKRGWRRVKLYFMIGLPGETEDDVRAIADLVTAVSGLRREIDGKWAEVTVSVNAFIPKPHTPFQREPMDAIASLERKRSLLRNAVRSRFIKLDFHSFPMSYIEAVFARGDRRLAAAIAAAWRSGGRFDGWGEYFDAGRWQAAFEASSVDPAFYATRRRDPAEILPWAHLLARPA